MPRRRQRRLVLVDSFTGSGRFLAERLVVLRMDKGDFARRLGKIEKDVNPWFGTNTRAPTRPAWESLESIANALELPFEEVRVGMGYRSPDQPEPLPLADWERESQRLARELLNLMRRVPEPARAGVRIAVAANLGALSAELERLVADGDQPIP